MTLRTMMKIGRFAGIFAIAVIVLISCGGNKTQSTTTVQRSANEKVNPLNQTTTMPLKALVLRGHTQSDSRTQKWLEERYNVKIELVVLPSGDTNAKTSLAMADDKERPDIVWWNNTMDGDFTRWRNAGLMVELTDWLNKYTVMRDYLDSQDPRSLFFALTDGKIYRIPGDISEPGCETMWIRKDWLDNLGLQVPKTLKELEDVMYAFTFNDPDKNGRNDTYGWGGAGDDLRYFWPWIQGSGGGYGNVYFDFVKLPNGTYGYSPAHDDTKLWISRVADQYKKGVITPNAMLNGVNFTEEMNRGYFGAFYRWVASNNPTSMTNFYAANPTAQLIPIDMVAGDNNDPQEDPGYLAAWCFFGITKNASDPERLYAMWDDMQTPEPYVMRRNGIKGTDWDYDQDGLYVRLISTTANTDENLGINIFSDMFTRKDEWNISNTPDTVELFKRHSQNSRGAYNKAIERTDVTTYTVWNSYGAELTDIRNGYIWSVLSGNESVATWDSYIARLKGAGLDEVLAELTEKYTKQVEAEKAYLASRGF